MTGEFGETIQIQEIWGMSPNSIASPNSATSPNSHPSHGTLIAY